MNNLKPRTLFLIDSLGAALSAFLLGIVLVQWQSYIGMPSKTLYYLAAAACFFMLFSLTNYFRNPSSWRPFLKAIALMNLLYCCATLMLVIYHFEQLTTLGVAYFLLEMAIIIALALFEYRTAIK